MSPFLEKIFKEAEGFVYDSAAATIKNNKDAIVEELKVLIPEGEASLPQINKVLTAHMNPIIGGIVGGELTNLEAEAGAAALAAVADVPAFLDEVCERLEAHAKLLRS